MKKLIAAIAMALSMGSLTTMATPAEAQSGRHKTSVATPLAVTTAGRIGAMGVAIIATIDTLTATDTTGCIAEMDQAAWHTLRRLLTSCL